MESRRIPNMPALGENIDLGAGKLARTDTFFEENVELGKTATAWLGDPGGFC